MKGLFQYLAPFAPDYSGAVSALFNMGGLIILCDPGGCSGNVCGYDEPRFYENPEGLFSAAIRDMDTIFGRDDKLEQKICKAAMLKQYPFIALIGTPVTSVIGTDLKALARIIKGKTNIPAFAVETNGMDLYDKGEQKALSSFLSVFAAQEDRNGKRDKICVLGATPLNLPGTLSNDKLKKLLPENSVLQGTKEFFEMIRHMDEVTKTLVLSPQAIKGADFLRRHFDVPYEIGFPDNPVFQSVRSTCSLLSSPKNCLIIHQQIVAESLSSILSDIIPTIDTASWFTVAPVVSSQCHFLEGEDDFITLVERWQYDVIIADPMFRRSLPNWHGTFIPFPHFAVSGDIFADVE